MNDQKTVLVLGSNSFSGSVTTSLLLQSGYRVVGISRSPENHLVYRPYRDLASGSNFEFLQLGSNFNAKDVTDICQKYGITSVINFVAQSMVAESWKYPWDWYETNIVWLSKMVTELTEWGKLEKFIQFTTPEVYGSTSTWITEEAIFNPTTPYAISRAASDWHLMAEFRRVKFPVIFTRTANVYGPYQQRYRLIPKALYAAISNSEFYLDGDGSSIRSFIFMEDVARALLRILELGEPGETYHISTRESHNIREIIEKCFQIVGADFTKLVKFTQDRPGKDKNYLLNSDKLRVNLGWGDVVGLEEGLNATRNWIQKEFSDFSAQPQIYFHQK